MAPQGDISSVQTVAAGEEEGSVGLVQTQWLPLEEGLVLQSGDTLAPITVAYETYGRLAPKRDNVILVCHALSGGAHAAGRHHPEERKPGWWDLYIGPGKALDTERFFIICINVLASPYGTTSPLSLNPQTGKPYGLDFPPVTVGDWVRLQQKVLQRLGIERLHTVIGGSTGGMQTFDWVVRYPDSVERAIVIGAAPAASPMVIALNHLQRQMILLDPDFQQGKSPVRGLALARMLAHLSYLSEEALQRKFGREPHHAQEYWGIMFQVESYLEYKGTTFVARFDPYSYLYITRAMDTFDLAASFGDGDLDRALSRVQARTLFISFTSDWLFPAEASIDAAERLRRLGRETRHVLIDSPWGHDSFLVDQVKPLLKPVIQEFILS